MSKSTSETTAANLKVALVGNPNSGKSSIFNLLTGLKQKIGNYPGVTVDKKTGQLRLKGPGGGNLVKLIDLPGTYSFFPDAEDERVTANILGDKEHRDHPDVVIYVADASNLKRSLLLFSQIADRKIPVILALNMMDIAAERKISIDLPKLSAALGVPIVEVNGRKGTGMENLKSAISNAKTTRVSFWDDKGIKASAKMETIERYQKIDGLLSGVVETPTSHEKLPFSHKLDRILTHKVYGFLIFFGLLALIFQGIFSWAEAPMDWIEGSILWLSQLLGDSLPEGILNSLLTEGIIPGLAGILVFIPQIAILFFFIAIMEETGYMARVSFIMDRLFRKFGLNGKSVIPLISGLACAIPAIMSARTISNRKERLITIFVTPFMSCSARLPVYALITALVIPSTALFGVFNLQGLAMMGLYLLGFVTALGAAFVMKKWMKTQEKSYFIMEMPVYRAPRWGDVFLSIFEKVKIFIIDAGKIIIAISIVLWFLASYGPGEEMEAVEAKYETIVPNDTLTSEVLEFQKSAELLEASYAGHLGKSIEPVIEPLGFNWKIGIALLTSFAAREVFVGTMSTIYSVGDEENTEMLSEKLSREERAGGGKIYDLATGISLLLFYAFAMQCMSTLAIVWRETKSWKWPLAQLGFMTGLAYLVSLIAYQLLS